MFNIQEQKDNANIFQLSNPVVLCLRGFEDQKMSLLN